MLEYGQSTEYAPTCQSLPAQCQTDPTCECLDDNVNPLGDAGRDTVRVDCTNSGGNLTEILGVL